MTLYVNSQGAHPDNIEIEGTGGHRAGLRQNVPGVISLTPESDLVCFPMKMGRASLVCTSVKFGMFFELTSAWETECNVHSTTSRASFAWIINAFEARGDHMRGWCGKCIGRRFPQTPESDLVCFPMQLRGVSFVLKSIYVRF